MEQGKAEKTIQSYTGDVAGFLSFLSNKEIQFDGILNRFAIHSYKKHLLQENYEIMRRLVNIIYGMMKNCTEYRMPNVEAQISNDICVAVAQEKVA